jgi:phosphoglycolate phosphatase-like HAD superfamily hydrolase
VDWKSTYNVIGYQGIFEMKLVRAVLFDWDGTLVNSLDVKIRNAGLLFHQRLDLSSEGVERAYREHSGIPRRQLFDAILADLGQPPLFDASFASLSKAFSDKNREALRDRNRPGLLPNSTLLALENLLQTGCLLFISSSADTDEIRDIAENLNLADYFIRSGGDIFGSRPGFNKGSQHVEHICTRHKLSVDELVFVGDDPADIRLGQAAGVFTIAKAGTYPATALQAYKPDAIINSLDELTTLQGLLFVKFDRQNLNG